MKISSSTLRTLVMIGMMSFFVSIQTNAAESNVLKNEETSTAVENHANDVEKFREAIRIATERPVSDQGQSVSSASVIKICGRDDSGSCCDCGDAYGCGTACSGNSKDGFLQGLLSPSSAFVVGGWSSFGYHNNNTRQSFVDSDLLSYNDVPDRLNLQQSWIYFGKEADGSRGLDFGFRFDAVYGTDAQSLQATGNPGAQTIGTGTFDASWDHGSYGWAMPQLYGEVAFDDWSIIGGYFLAPVGYESSRTVDNFFYSRSLTMFNSEPFTHTGMLATYKGFEGLTIYGGWSLGWDTGFDQNFGGNNGIGGFSIEVNEFVTFTYLAEVGDYGFRGEDGYNHSVVLELELTDNLEYAVQSDYVRHNDSFGTVGLKVEEFGVNQYLYYQLNDAWWVGGRAEWWKSSAPTGVHQSYYEVTGGLNYQPLPNVTVRPEIRYDWTPGEDNFTAVVAPNYNQWVTGIDCVITY